MAKGKKPSTVELAKSLVLPVLEELGLELWDLRFEKEGSAWFLRYFIDKEGGVSINDCEDVSRRVDKLLDESDPISQSYTLEVSSPGIERQLTKDWHFEKFMGSPVLLRLIRPVDGVRDFKGTLAEKQGEEITLALDEEFSMTVRQNELAYPKLDDFEVGGNKE